VGPCDARPDTPGPVRPAGGRGERRAVPRVRLRRWARWTAPNVTTCTGTVSQAHPGLRLGRMGAWLNPAYGDDARTGLAIQAESLGHAARQMSLPLRHIRRRKRRSLMTSTVIPIAIAAFLSGAVADP
jgi:hypothetical protein